MEHHNPFMDQPVLFGLLTEVATAVYFRNNTYTENLRRGCPVQVADSTMCGFARYQGIGENGVSTSTSEIPIRWKTMLWYNIALRMTPTMYQVIEWARDMPGFKDLPVLDRMILIKGCFFEVWLTKIALWSTADYIVFDDGLGITRNQLRVIYDDDFLTALFNYMQCVRDINMAEQEQALFAAVLLFCPARPGLTSNYRIHSLLYHYEAALFSFMPGVGGSSIRFTAFLAARLLVSDLASRHDGWLNWCRYDWYSLQAPELFSEIFNIPTK